MPQDQDGATENEIETETEKGTGETGVESMMTETEIEAGIGTEIETETGGALMILGTLEIPGIPETRETLGIEETHVTRRETDLENTIIEIVDEITVICEITEITTETETETGVENIVITEIPGVASPVTLATEVVIWITVGNVIDTGSTIETGKETERGTGEYHGNASTMTVNSLVNHQVLMVLIRVKLPCPMSIGVATKQDDACVMKEDQELELIHLLSSSPVAPLILRAQSGLMTKNRLGFHNQDLKGPI